MIKEQINSDLKEAMKQKNTQKLSALRSIKTAITTKETTKGKVQELNDQGVLMVIESLVKKTKQSIEMFKNGGREDLVKSEKDQLNILESFLPKKLNEDETKELIQTMIDSGASSMGDIMKQIKQTHTNTVDGKLASQITRELLS